MPLRPDYLVRSARLVLRSLTEPDVAGTVAYRSLPEVCRRVPLEPMDGATVATRIRGKWSTAAVREGARAAGTLVDRASEEHC